MSAALKIPVPMTVDEFLNWDSGDGPPWRLVNGEPQAMAPANRTHGSLSPSSADETWANVSMYTSIPSVREILVVRVDAIGCALPRPREDGTWPSDPDAIGEGDFVLDSIGFRVKPREVYATARLARTQAAGGVSR